ncbi:Gfo/Idh/MocA family protein [Umezawaea beigongshangensis]|uniref:Gfo/Idh/MocA family protein n=1 Tax=Umezawaea beigongshangensis TaxID=2780383 RepID=UPI0018F264BF|nr:Gfo/Idh/MocA family oxidoreductase [Umezawaea beigongshangensis]
MTTLTDRPPSDPRRPIGVGIVGLSAAGAWAAGGHLPALAAVEGIELRALAASSEASARAAEAAYGVPGYTSVEQLAGDDEVDLVVVAVKVPRHRELVLPVLRAGVPVLTEWPLAVDLREAEEMQRAAGRTRTFVGLQGRSSPVFRWLRDLVSRGYVGEVLSVTVVASSTEWGTPVSQRAVYTLDRELGATMLTIAFGHAVDLVSMVVGELQDVVATTATRRRQVPLGDTGRVVPMTAEDQIAISGTLAGGAVLSAHHRGGAASGAGFSLVVDGTEGMLDVTAAEFPHIGPVTVRGARSGGQLAELALPSGYDDYPDLAGTVIHTLTHSYAAIRDDLVHGTTVAPDFAHAVRRHRLLDAIVRSAATGRRTTTGL